MAFTIIYISILFTIILVMLSLCFLLMLKLKHSKEKFSVFECGFDPLSILRLPFSLSFYIITIIFLIFDVELVLVLPFVFNLKSTLFESSLIVLSLFFFVLLIGFIYEWMMGLLNWLT